MNHKLEFTKTEQKHLNLLYKNQQSVQNICDLIYRNSSCRDYDTEAFDRAMNSLYEANFALCDIMSMIEGEAKERLDKKLERQQRMIDKMDSDDE